MHKGRTNANAHTHSARMEVSYVLSLDKFENNCENEGEEGDDDDGGGGEDDDDDDDDDDV